MPQVVVAGPASWNTIVRVPALPTASGMCVASGHEETLGGTSAGKALTLARLGMHVTLRTALGDDDAAAHIRAALAHPHLTVAAGLGRGPSERHLNLMTPDGGRASIYLHFPPEPGPVPREVADAVARADVVVADLADHARAVLPLARAADVPVWCDLHDWDGVEEFHREFAQAADVVVASADRLADPRAFVAERVAAGSRWAVCTLGSRGAVGLGRVEGWVEVAALPVDHVLDTNGAGDAFVSGLLLGHLEGRSLHEAMRLGAAAGALAVASPGLVSDADANAVRRLAGVDGPSAPGALAGSR